MDLGCISNINDRMSLMGNDCMNHRPIFVDDHRESFRRDKILRGRIMTIQRIFIFIMLTVLVSSCARRELYVRYSGKEFTRERFCKQSRFYEKDYPYLSLIRKIGTVHVEAVVESEGFSGDEIGNAIKEKVCEVGGNAIIDFHKTATSVTTGMWAPATVHKSIGDVGYIDLGVDFGDLDIPREDPCGGEALSECLKGKNHRESIPTLSFHCRYNSEAGLRAMACGDLAQALVFGNAKKATILGIAEPLCNNRIGSGCKALGMIAFDYGDLGEARRYFIKACDEKDLHACLLYGHTLWAEGAKTEALFHFRKSCDRGYPYACYQMGKLLLSENEVDEAKAGFRQLCDSGEVKNACVDLAVLIMADDETEGTEMLRKHCDRDNVEACNQYAKILLSKKKDKQAVELLKAMQRKETGTTACSILGDYYIRNGKKKKGKSILRPCCKKLTGGPACGTLGMHLMDEGQPRAALLKYRAGCMKGNGTACWNGAEILDELEGFSSARSMYAKACALGNDLPCKYIKLMQRAPAPPYSKQVRKSLSELCNEGKSPNIAPACKRLGSK